MYIRHLNVDILLQKMTKMPIHVLSVIELNNKGLKRLTR